MKLFIGLTFTLLQLFTSAQTPHLLARFDSISFRGLSVVNKHIIWASGTHGTVVKSVDGGKHWTRLKVRDFEERDFRDIEAFDDKIAVLMAVGEPAQILKTTDGGESWKIVFSDSTRGMFLDALDFANKKDGVVVGDPVNGLAFIAYTRDQGEHWLVDQNAPPLLDGEAFFAASGSNIKAIESPDSGSLSYIMATGGSHSRLFIGSSAYSTPLQQGSQSSGANALLLIPGTGKIVIVGGDYRIDSMSRGNCTVYSVEGGSFVQPKVPPHGYRSCVHALSPGRLIACGTSGIDLSTDGGMTWKLISRQSFHVCAGGGNSTPVFLAGPDGKIAELNW